MINKWFWIIFQLQKLQKVLIRSLSNVNILWFSWSYYSKINIFEVLSLWETVTGTVTVTDRSDGEREKLSEPTEADCE